MIEIKRNCSSSIRHDDEKIVFGDFTIKVTGSHLATFERFIDNSSEKKLDQILMWFIAEGMENFDKIQNSIERGDRMVTS